VDPCLGVLRKGFARLVDRVLDLDWYDLGFFRGLRFMSFLCVLENLFSLWGGLFLTMA
jgi:hypothetical protein